MSLFFRKTGEEELAEELILDHENKLRSLLGSSGIRELKNILINIAQMVILKIVKTIWSIS